MKLTGKVVFLDLETGVWMLEADGGVRYVLAGGDRAIKAEGRRVEVEGEVQAESIGFAMAGPVFRVSRYRFI